MDRVTGFFNSLTDWERMEEVMDREKGDVVGRGRGKSRSGVGRDRGKVQAGEDSEGIEGGKGLVVSEGKRRRTGKGEVKFGGVESELKRGGCETKKCVSGKIDSGFIGREAWGGRLENGF